jgi:uncharacterized protein YdeI (YjbR/CyaY-like superfamily)
VDIAVGSPGREANEAWKSGARMIKEEDIAGGVVHELPMDFRQALSANPKALATWKDITPLARNEWICWIESAKKLPTRSKRIDWGCENLEAGKRRPCCWPGCPHRQSGVSAAALSETSSPPG